MLGRGFFASAFCETSSRYQFSIPVLWKPVPRKKGYANGLRQSPKSNGKGQGASLFQTCSTRVPRAWNTQVIEGQGKNTICSNVPQFPEVYQSDIVRIVRGNPQVCKPRSSNPAIYTLAKSWNMELLILLSLYKITTTTTFSSKIRHLQFPLTQSNLVPLKNSTSLICGTRWNIGTILWNTPL
jgi:hypothetical protein